VISRATESSCAIRNELGFPLWVKQAGTAAHFVPLLADQTLQFAWFEPAKPRRLEFLFDASDNSRQTTVLEFTEPGSSGKLAVFRGGKKSQAAYQVQLEGCTAVFALVNAVVGAKPPIKADTAVRFDLLGLSVSLVVGKPRAETLLFTMKNLTGQYSAGKETQELRVKVGAVQLDDMRADSVYPVIFEAFEKKDQMLEFSGVLSMAGGRRIFRRIFVNLAKSRVSVDFGVVSELLEGYRGVLARARVTPDTLPIPDWSAFDVLDLDVGSDRPIIESVAINSLKLGLSFSPGDSAHRGTSSDSSIFQKILYISSAAFILQILHVICDVD
jgi:hypothetical protein